MAATVSSKNDAIPHPFMIDAIRTAVAFAETSVLPFGNQLFKHRKLLF